MKFYSQKDEVITIKVDKDSAHMCHFLSLKSKQEEVVKEKLKNKSAKGSEVNLADLDT